MFRALARAFGAIDAATGGTGDLSLSNGVRSNWLNSAHKFQHLPDQVSPGAVRQIKQYSGELKGAVERREEFKKELQEVLQLCKKGYGQDVQWDLFLNKWKTDITGMMADHRISMGPVHTEKQHQQDRLSGYEGINQKVSSFINF
jgi:hypothetical protein